MTDCPRTLSVSFGMFSCTLEGFDDPVAMIREIADHFHDLSTRDRGFGTHGPASEADLLRRIAESDGEDGFEAQVIDGTITLRRGDDDPQSEDADWHEALRLPPSAPNVTDLFADDAVDDLDECDPIDDGSAEDDPAAFSADDDSRDSVAAFLAGFATPDCPQGRHGASDRPDPVSFIAEPVAASFDAPGPTADAMPESQGSEDEDTWRRDAAMDRLMSMANERLEDAEGHRRRSAITHLRAAVAATRAEEEARDTRRERDTGQIGQFRDDLDRAVRPSRPAAPGLRAAQRPRLGAVADRLVLAAGQRVDTAGAAIAPARPRRVEPDPATGRDREFADFAERIGASEIPDLFEAAVAYSMIVDGRQGASRATILRRVGQAAETPPSRETGLELFDGLVGAGRLRDLGQGRFGIAENAPVLDRARAGAD